MRGRDEKAVALIGAILDGLLTTTGAQNTGAAGATLKQRVGALRATAPEQLRDNTLFTALAACFDAARETGAGVPQFERLRLRIAGLPAEAPAPILIRSRALCFCLVQQARALAATDFVSRDDIDAALRSVTASFETSEMDAADAKEAQVYQTLVTLRAAVVRDLTARSRPLPKMVSFAFPTSMPAVVLANRLYGDAGRAGELLAENRTVHPLFVRPSGRALSA